MFRRKKEPQPRSRTFRIVRAVLILLVLAVIAIYIFSPEKTTLK